MPVRFNAKSHLSDRVTPSLSHLNKPAIESKPGENGALLVAYVCLCLLCVLVSFQRKWLLKRRQKRKQ